MSVFIFSILILLSLDSFSQSLRQKGHFFLNQQYISPSAMAFSSGLTLHGNYRGQWFGVEGAPQDQELAASLFLPDIKSAVGLSINNEILGAFRTTYVEAQFAHRLNFKNVGISMGVSFGFENTLLKGDILTTPEQTPNQVNTDPFLPLSRETAIRPLMGLGASVNFKGLQVDVSANNLLNSVSKLKGDSLVLSYRRGMVFSVHASYTKAIGSSFMINPGAQYITDFVQNQTSIYVLSSYKSLVHFGLMYRGYNNISNDAFIPMLGIQPTKAMKIFYSYEITTSGLSRSTAGTHELSITYNIAEDKIFKKGKVSYNPRFL